jgi:single-strand DNA-binding protein
MSLNKVMLIGNVGSDPEIRYLDQNSQNGSAKVASFRLATSERFRDRNGDVRENTEWHNIVAWRNSADIVERFVKKGTQLYIEGRIRTRSWTDQTGNKRYTTEINVDNLQLLGRRPDGQEGQPAYGDPSPAVQQVYSQPAPAQPVPEAPAAAPVDDDLPF